MARKFRRLVAAMVVCVSSASAVVATHQPTQAHAMAGDGCIWLPWTQANENQYYWEIVGEGYHNGAYMIEICFE